MKRITINIPGDRGKLYEVVKYPAGEIQVRLTNAGIAATGDKDAYVISANPIPDLMELAGLKNALDGLSNYWYHTTLELMYLPYARADRHFQYGDSFGLQTFAVFINALHFHTVYTFDVHSLVASREIPSLVNLDPIHHYDQISSVLKSIGTEGLVLIAPDKGAQQRYDLEAFKFPVLVGGKNRDASTGKLSGFTIDKSVRGYDRALIIDDICDGGTFIGLAEQIRKLNPTIELYLYVSHGIFSQGLGKLKQIFKQVFVSDFTFDAGYKLEKV